MTETFSENIYSITIVFDFLRDIFIAGQEKYWWEWSRSGSQSESS